LAALLAGDQALGIIGLFQVAFDAVEVVCEAKGYVGQFNLPFGLNLLRFDEFVPGET
jgi:hypothetical protein